MRFGTILLWGDSYNAYTDRLKLADGLGYDLIGVGDSQSVYREMYVSLAVAAAHTSNAMIASMVTNPVTRHPAVAAAAMASVDELSGGRAVMGLGGGGSAVLNIDEPRPKYAQLQEYLLALRALFRGETVDWHGKKIHAQWIQRPVPLYLAAYGPRAMRLAGAVADGVIIAASTIPKMLAVCLDNVRAGARDAGRDPETVETWVMVRGSVRDTQAEAILDVKANLASAAKYVRRGIFDEFVPSELLPKFAELRRRYAAREHVQWAGANAAMIDELGLTDYLAERFSIAGTPEQCRSKIRAMREVGINNIVIPAVDRDPENVIRRLATEVFPEFRD